MPAIWLGDLNVAPEPIDVYHPDHRVNDPDFHIDAREAYRHAVSWGFTDVFRKLYPDRVQYTYWDYFRNAFAHNWGWRIDHILATAPLAAACRTSDVDLELVVLLERPITRSSGRNSIATVARLGNSVGAPSALSG